MARTDSKLLAALREKLGRGGAPVSLQAIQQRRSRLQALIPMPTDIATYVVAQRDGIRLNKFIADSAVLAAVADADARLRVIEGVETAPKASRRQSRQAGTRVTKVAIARTIDADVPGLSASHAKEAKAMAERVYPMLYVFENSVRDLIERVLRAK